MKRPLIFLGIIILFIGIGYFFWKEQTKQPTYTSSLLVVDPLADEIFQQGRTWLPDAAWSQPTMKTEQTPYGSIQGFSRTGVLTVASPEVNHFDDITFFTNLGFTQDDSLLADGPAASSWGYTRKIDGETQIVIVSYKANPTNIGENEPVQFNCPCTAEASIFVSEPFTPQTQEQ